MFFGIQGPSQTRTHQPTHPRTPPPHQPPPIPHPPRPQRRPRTRNLHPADKLVTEAQYLEAKRGEKWTVNTSGRGGKGRWGEGSGGQFPSRLGNRDPSWEVRRALSSAGSFARHGTGKKHRIVADAALECLQTSLKWGDSRTIEGDAAGLGQGQPSFIRAFEIEIWRG